MDKGFRYYFQHPWSRLVVAYLVIFCNFLIFAEDPVSHSQTEANVIVVGNCFSFVTNKYPGGGGWRFLKVLLWLLAVLTGLIAGKFLFHQRLFGQLFRLKMFREDHGSWMTMFFSTILFLFIFSHIYNLCLLMAGNMRAYIITDFMGIRNESFMKVAAVGTWMGDFVTAWMVTDMMLQDKPYPDWGKSARAFWKKGNVRIILFWTVLFTLTSAVVLVITTDWISWDKLNRGFLPSDEVSRAFLASFILVFDLLIIMQDWEFPHFMGDVDVNLPGLPYAHLQFKLPYFQKIFKEEYHIHITGTNHCIENRMVAIWGAQHTQKGRQLALGPRRRRPGTEAPSTWQEKQLWTTLSTPSQGLCLRGQCPPCPKLHSWTPADATVPNPAGGAGTAGPDPALPHFCTPASSAPWAADPLAPL
ncbi:transmembrane protein 117 isoform X2 [Chelonia mydas]|uniref:transmembrane protein 117 isoform X2 n=1 Tax=Chelonia mydas TaxID=8469 RepID=UPI001CA852D7|nr:transmembrane protein 117 isoform X2 [Chelonia mydas]